MTRDSQAGPVIRAPQLDPVDTDPLAPASTRVVVIGGGIVGVSAALCLAERGVPVTLCEKGRVAGEQSSRNWGWCRNTGRDHREIELMERSTRLWREMNGRVGGETGYRQKGIVFLCRTPREVAKMERWLQEARPYGLDSHLLSAAETAELNPHLFGGVSGGLYTPSDGQAEPQRAVPAMVRKARELGAKVVEGCAVRGLETRAGRISAVVTEHGTIACDAVLCAGGAWSSLFLGSLGLRLPQLGILASVGRTNPMTGGPEVATGAAGYGTRKRLDGGYTIANLGGEVHNISLDSLRFTPDFARVAIGRARSLRLRVGKRSLDETFRPRRWALDAPSPFEAVRTLDPAPHLVGLQAARKRLARDCPYFAEARLTQCWGGLIDVTPDVLPTISAIDGHPGLFVATGFSGHGFGIGPSAGWLAADLVMGDRPLVDPSPFRFARFGERPRPRPAYTPV